MGLKLNSLDDRKEEATRTTTEGRGWCLEKIGTILGGWEEYPEGLLVKLTIIRRPLFYATFRSNSTC